MKIAHIDTEKTWRGGQQQVLFLIQQLKVMGHTNFPVVYPDGALEARLNDERIPSTSIRPLGEWDLFTGGVLRKQLLDEKVDIVHAHSGHGVAMGAFATWNTSIPMIVTRRVDFHLSNNPFSKWKYRRAQEIIAISHGVKTILLEDGIPNHKIHVIPSAIQLQRYSDIEARSKGEMGAQERDIVIGQVAALAAHKDQKTFIDAMAQLRSRGCPAVGVIVGEGELRRELELYIKSRNLEKYIHLMGFQEDPLAYLKAFNVFCLSSKEEGLGTSILDAMALKIPVVATRVGGIPDIVENGVTGVLTEPQNPEALATGILNLLNDTSQKERMIENAQQRVQNYDIARVAQKIESLYQSVLSTDLSTWH